MVKVVAELMDARCGSGDRLSGDEETEVVSVGSRCPQYVGVDRS